MDFHLVRMIPDHLLRTDPELSVRLEKLEGLLRQRDDLRSILESRLPPDDKLREMEKLLGSEPEPPALPTPPMTAPPPPAMKLPTLPPVRNEWLHLPRCDS